MTPLTRLLSVGAILGGVLAPAAPTSAVADGPPAQSGQVRQVLPPGESGTWTTVDEANGRATGNYGPHTQDQRDAYWGYRFANGGFTKNGTPTSPAAGVEIYRDPLGVPSVYGTTGRNVWFGAGYAAAQDRLFEVDAIRRLATGRLGELAGPSAVPDDVATRVTTYTSGEYDAMYAGLPQASKDAISGYVDGVNAWIATVRADPTKLPAEYAVLTSQPEPITIDDVVAMGVYMTRFVASQGGGEMDNVAALRELVKRYGSTKGRAAFDDLFWKRDAKAVTTVPAASGTFSNDDTPAKNRASVTRSIERWARTLPAGLAKGNGTGAYPKPASSASAPATVVQTGLTRAAETLVAWGESLHGGSYQIAVSGSRTKSHKPMLESAPQLGWTAPSELYILEVHGGGYDARGATVPGLPVVGIGYGKRVAWALTTGYSKTVDSFVEKTRANPTSGGPRQYLHNGTWRNESCRNETVAYRNATQGAPAGPATQRVTVQVCRTLHGPVVAQSGSLQRTVQYAMWKREVGTINGVLQWDRAQNLKQFAAGVAQVTWNENVAYAGADGHIAYWHPGLYPRRSPYVDQRFPAPGTGRYDWRGFRRFSQMPHAVDPKQGWLANWNNLPAVGWNTGDVQGYSGGPYDHQQVIAKQLRKARGLTLADLQRIDNHVGNSDARSIAYLPLLRALAAKPPRSATAADRKALSLLARWNGQASDRTSGVATGGKDPAAATLFDAYVRAVRARLFAKALPKDLVARASAVSLHTYDVTTLDNLALRVLKPSTSSLRPALDYKRGRSTPAIELGALHDAMRTLTSRFGTSDPTRWRRDHPTTNVESLTGVVGPSFTEPYEDRGSYIHLVAY